jgi:hypothetical protein
LDVLNKPLAPPSAGIFSRIVLTAAACGLALAGAPGCAGGSGSADSATSGLPDYTPEEAAVFDDVLTPAIFGVSVEEKAGSRDRKLAERLRDAEFVVAMRVSTLAYEGALDRGAYRVTLVPVPPLFSGSRPDGDVEIVVKTDNPTFQLLHQNRHTWVGSRLILFGRRYHRAGKAELHWRGEPDTPEVRAAIESQALLR